MYLKDVNNLCSACDDFVIMNDVYEWYFV